MTEGGGLFVQVGQAELLPRGRYAQIHRKPVVGERMRGGGGEGPEAESGLGVLEKQDEEGLEADEQEGRGNPCV